MNGITAFLISKTGVFAAIAAVLGVLVTTVALANPVITRLREKRRERAELTVTEPHISEVSRSSNSCELRFEIANRGGTAAVALAARLRVLEHVPSTATVPTVTEAPLPVYQHRVKLQVGKDVYDVRARTYGPALPPISLAEAEVEAFVVKLVADKPQRYTVCIEVEWYDAKRPSEVKISQSRAINIDFPHRVPGGAPTHAADFEISKITRPHLHAGHWL